MSRQHQKRQRVQWNRFEFVPRIAIPIDDCREQIYHLTGYGLGVSAENEGYFKTREKKSDLNPGMVQALFVKRIS